MHRAAAVVAQLPQHPRHHLRGGSDRLAGDPSRLRIPLGERRLRREGRALGLRVHRPAPGHDPADGRQGQREGRDDQGRRSLRSRLRGCAARGPEGGRQDRARGRLPGDHQGGGRRRRPRHARRAHRGGAAVRGDAHAGRGAGGVRQPDRLHGEVPDDAAPHRDPGARRRAQERGVAGRARLLDAAAPPEDHRGGARAGHSCRDCSRASATDAPRRPGRSATAAPARSSSSTRTTSSTSSR